MPVPGATPTLSSPRRPAGAARGAVSLLGAACVIASFTVLARASAPMCGPFAQSTVRSVAAAALLAAAARVRGRGFTLSAGELRRIVPLGALTTALGVLLAVAVQAAPVAVVLAIVYGTSVITAVLIGWLVLAETATQTRGLAVGLAVAGLAAYAPELAGSQGGITAAVLAGACEGICNVLRRQLRTTDRQVAAMYQYLIGGVVAIGALMISGESLIKTISGVPVISMAAYAVASAVLGTLLFAGFGAVDVSVGAVLLATQLAFVTVLGLRVLGERPDAHELIGAVTITIAAGVAGLGERPMAGTFAVWRGGHAATSMAVGRGRRRAGTRRRRRPGGRSSVRSAAR